MPLGGEVANLVVALKLDDSGFSGKLNNAARQLKGFDRGLSQMGRGVGQVGSGLSKIATVGAAAAVGGLAAVISTAASMEEAFTGVRKTVDASEAQFGDLEDAIRSMSAQSGTSFEELARIGEIGGALGVGVADLEGFIDVVNRLSVSTDLTVESASTALGQLRTVLDLDDSALRGLADTLVALGNAGASTEPQIVDLASRFAIAGDRAGLSVEEILALSSAVTSMGVEVEAGGTALSKTFNDIAVAIGTGGEEVQGFTDLLGITADEFRKNWEEDALGTFQEWLKELSKLDPIAQAVAMEQAGITGSRQQAAIGAIAKNWEFVGEQLEIARDAEGALNEESDKFFATSARGFTRLKENLRLTAATIGAELLPITNELITDFTTWLQQDDVQRGIKRFAEDLADGIRGLVDEIKGSDFSALVETFKAAAGFAKAAFDAFMALPSDMRNLLAGFIAVNKVTGGAVGDIVKGLGNLATGGIRIALAMRGSTPANPLFVSDVSGGLGGKGGGPAGGGKGKFPILGVAGAVGVALALSGSDNPAADPVASQHMRLTELREAGLLTDATFQDLWARAYGGENINAKLDQLERAVSGGKGGPAGTTGTSEWARGLDGVKTSIDSGTSAWAKGLSDLKTEVSMLPDTSMLAPAVNALTANLPPIRSKADATLAAQYQALQAARGTQGEIGRLANTPHNVNVDNNITIPVHVSATMIQNSLYRLRTTTGSGGFI